MSHEEELRRRRDFVAMRYGPHAIGWQETVSRMSTEQVTAIYLRMQRDNPPAQKPLPFREDPEDPQGKLF